MRFPDKDPEEEHLKTKLNFQEIYIRLLEAEIYKMKGENELELMRNESDYSNNMSISLKIKFDSVYMLCEKLQKGIDDTRRPLPYCPLDMSLPDHFQPPNHCQLPRVANIGLYDSPGSFHKSVILRWKQGKNEMGNALYMDAKENLNMETVGFLVEKFFYDICMARIKTLKGEKLGHDVR